VVATDLSGCPRNPTRWHIFDGKFREQHLELKSPMIIVYIVPGTAGTPEGAEAGALLYSLI